MPVDTLSIDALLIVTDGRVALGLGVGARGANPSAPSIPSEPLKPWAQVDTEGGDGGYDVGGDAIGMPEGEGSGGIGKAASVRLEPPV